MTMKHPLTRRAWIEVDFDKLGENYLRIKDSLADNCDILAVVKADAYGFCDSIMSGEFYRLGCRNFGVSNIEEAVRVREAVGGDAMVLQLGYTDPQEASVLAAHQITQTVIHLPHALALDEALAEIGQVLDVHIKLDTGMRRIGFDCLQEDVVDQLVQVCNLPQLRVTGVFTHFSVADEAKEESQAFTQLQFERFLDTVQKVEALGYNLGKKHTCNSAATLSRRHMHLDLVRPGSILYGLATDDEMGKNTLPLQGIFSLKTRISAVKQLRVGETVSYGRKFKAEEMRWASTVTLGYADGYSRGMSGQGWANVGGKRAALLGRVCMDQMVFDTTGIDVAVGDEVVCMAWDGVAPNSVEYANCVGSIDTEIAPILGKRLPRLYFRKGKVVDSKVYR